MPLKFKHRKKYMVRFNVSVKCEVSCEASPDGLRYLWREADYTGLANYFNTVNWFNMLTTNLTPDSLWGAFTNTLNSAIQNFVPAGPVHNKQSMRTQNKTTYPNNMRSAMSRKHCL